MTSLAQVMFCNAPGWRGFTWVGLFIAGGLYTKHCAMDWSPSV